MQDKTPEVEPLEPLRAPREILETEGTHFKSAWRIVDRHRAQRGRQGHVDWPEWCFLPGALWYRVWQEAGLPAPCKELEYYTALLPVLGAWRVTQGVYRFEPALFDALCDTPVMGEVPCEVFFRLPEWCVYVMTPGLCFGCASVRGAFCYLDFDIETQCPCLCVFINLNNGWAFRYAVPLTSQPFEQLLDETCSGPIQFSGDRARAECEWLDSVSNTDGKVVLEKVVSLLLFLCTQNAELSSGARRPQNPLPKRTRKGVRTFPAERATTWEVGTRLGSALRADYARTATEAANAGEGTHARPRAHIRRAHYHHYWKGPLESSARQLILKWLPPIPVNVGSPEDLATTIKPVEAANDAHKQAA